MDRTLEELEAEVLKLSAQERARLAKRLLHSLSAIDVFELRVSVRMGAPLLRLPISLQTVSGRVQQLRNDRVAHFVAHRHELFRKLPDALRGPA